MRAQARERAEDLFAIKRIKKCKRCKRPRGAFTLHLQSAECVMRRDTRKSRQMCQQIRVIFRPHACEDSTEAENPILSIARTASEEKTSATLASGV